MEGKYNEEVEVQKFERKHGKVKYVGKTLESLKEINPNFDNKVRPKKELEEIRKKQIKEGIRFIK